VFTCSVDAVAGVGGLPANASHGDGQTYLFTNQASVIATRTGGPGGPVTVLAIVTATLT